MAGSSAASPARWRSFARSAALICFSLLFSARAFARPST